MIDIKLIEPEMTYPLRHRILRPHQTIDDCKYETDYGDLSFHVGAFSQGQLISIASFCVEHHSEFSYENQYRLRGMATVEEFRSIGAARAVVRYAENIIKSKGTELLWCKARVNVQSFYQKLDFSTHGEIFDYPPIGPHIVMYKTLESLIRRSLSEK